MSAGVVVVGSLTIDLTSHSTRLPHPGETVLGTQFTMVPGGKGANQALAAAQIGAPTWMVGCVGDDMFRSVVVSRMEAAGVRLDHLRVVPKMATGVAHIRVDGAGENNIVMVPLANGALRDEDIDAALDALTDQVSVALIQLEIPLDVATHAVRAAHAAGLIVVLDPAPAPPTPLPGELYGAIDLVTPNESEASVLSGIDVVDRVSAGQAGAWFVERGCASAAISAIRQARSRRRSPLARSRAAEMRSRLEMWILTVASACRNLASVRLEGVARCPEFLPCGRTIRRLHPTPGSS